MKDLGTFEALTWKPKGRRSQLHFSGLDLMWRCGVAFYFRYIKRIPSLPSSAVHVGHGVDTAANVNLLSKITTNALLPTAEVLDIARDATRESFDRGGAVPMEGEPTSPRALCDLAVDKAVRLAEVHSVTLAPKLQPKAVQQDFTIEIPDYDFDVVGTRDLDEVDGTVRDLKTSKRSPQTGAAFYSNQGTLYAMSRWVVNQQPPPIRFGVDTVVDLKRGPKVVSQMSERGMSDFAAMAARLKSAHAIIGAGDFDLYTPARQGADWWCSQKFCSYTEICPHFRQPITVAMGELDDENGDIRRETTEGTQQERMVAADGQEHSEEHRRRSTEASERGTDGDDRIHRDAPEPEASGV